MRTLLPADTPGRLIALTWLACAIALLLVLLRPTGAPAPYSVLQGIVHLVAAVAFAGAAVTAARRARGAHRPLVLAIAATAAVVLLAALLDFALLAAHRVPRLPSPGMWLIAVGANACLLVGLAGTAGWRPRALRVQALLDTLLLATAAAMLGGVMGSLWASPVLGAAQSALAPLVRALRVAPVAQLLLLAIVLALRGEQLGWRTSVGLGVGTIVFALGTMMLGRLSTLDPGSAAAANVSIAVVVLLGYSAALVPAADADARAEARRARRDRPTRHQAGLVVAAAAVTALCVLVLGMRSTPSPEIAAAAALFVVLLAMRAVHALRLHQKKARLLARSIAAERELSGTLEQRVVERTAELAEAQRVLQRMWTLGQHVTLELNPQRVLDRFMEAVLDVARADAGALGLVVDDQRLRLVAALGLGADAVGSTVPMEGSAMGRVVRSGESWAERDLSRQPHMVFARTTILPPGESRGVAVVPVQRRGERIGALMLVTHGVRGYTAAELARIESMTDMLSVALANAELVETLRQAEWRFRTLFRAAPDAVLTVLASGRVREANEAVRDVTGLDPVQLVGRVFADLAVADERPRLEAALQRALGGRPTRLEVRLARAGVGGGPADPAAPHRVVSLAASRLPEADPPTVLVIARDITAEREMRARLAETERLAAVGELVAGVAHEVNNPLSTISAYAQLLLRDAGLAGAHRESIEVMRGETVRASQVVKDLLAFARRSEPQRESVDLAHVVERTVRLHAYHLASGNLRAELDLPPDLPAVNGDGRQLQQVVLNLVTNAVQAMRPQGTGTLRVSARAEACPERGGRETCVVLDIADTGPGVAVADRARIFEPFFTTKPEGEGTGLGLSVSYGIVAAHGGSLVLAETSPAGSIFRVTLPAAAVPGCREAGTGDEHPLAARSPLAGIRLLFVDDEPALRRGMEQFGRLRGFDVVTAEEGGAALALLQTVSVDAVVCDLRMPGMDGLTFHTALGRERPGLARRTVFITGDTLGVAGRAGSPLRQPTLTKPFVFERLEETLAALLRGAPVATAAR